MALLLPNLPRLNKEELRLLLLVTGTECYSTKITKGSLVELVRDNVRQMLPSGRVPITMDAPVALRQLLTRMILFL
jgi:hypothetical protein